MLTTSFSAAGFGALVGGLRVGEPALLFVAFSAMGVATAMNIPIFSIANAFPGHEGIHSGTLFETASGLSIPWVHPDCGVFCPLRKNVLRIHCCPSIETPSGIELGRFLRTLPPSRSFFTLYSSRRALAIHTHNSELNYAHNGDFSFASQCQLPTQNGL